MTNTYKRILSILAAASLTLPQGTTLLRSAITVSAADHVQSIAQYMKASAAPCADLAEKEPAKLTIDEATAFPGDRNVVVRLHHENTSELTSGIRIYHAPELKPVFSEKKPTYVKVDDIDNSLPYNPELCMIGMPWPMACKFYFDIPQDTKPGRYPITIELVKNVLTPEDLVIQNGYIEVISNLRGDANGDGIIDKADLEAVKKFIAAANQDGLTEQGRKNADVDRDGTVSETDASAILYYVEKGSFQFADPALTTTTTTTVSTTTTTTYTVPEISVDIDLTPPTKTEYAVGETIDYSGESCIITLSKLIPGNQMLTVTKELMALSELPSMFGDIQIEKMLDEEGNEVGTSYNGAYFAERIEIEGDSVVATIGPYMSNPAKPGIYTVKVAVKTEDEKHIFSEKSFDITVKEAGTTTVISSTTTKPTTTVTTFTTSKPTTTVTTSTTPKPTTTTTTSTTPKPTTTTTTSTTPKPTTTSTTSTTPKPTTTTTTSTTPKPTTTTTTSTTPKPMTTTTTSTTPKPTTTTTTSTTPKPTTATTTSTTPKPTTTPTTVTTEFTGQTTTTATGTTEPEYLLGDVNNDRTVSVEDAQLALLAYVQTMSGLESGLTEQQTKAADINGDKTVSVEDAQIILLYYVSNTVSGQNITWDDLIGKKAQALPRLIQKKNLSLNL